MAARAMRDQEERVVQVNRQELIKILQTNREKHLNDYKEAKLGYRRSLVKSIEEAFADATATLSKRHKQILDEVASITDEKLEHRQDQFLILNHMTINMKVPRCYAKEYDAAIDMAKWDVRETLELSHAEFQCFVRDVWEWTNEARETMMMYSSAR